MAIVRATDADVYAGGEKGLDGGSIHSEMFKVIAVDSSRTNSTNPSNICVHF